LKNPDGSVNWEKAYKVLSSDLIVEDIERIRRDLFKDTPETKILLYGRSGGGFLIQRYLAKYSRFARRAFIRAAPNSVIMKQLGYPQFKYFYNILTETDDNHTMSIHKECYALLRNTFFTFGIKSKELQNAKTAPICREWKQESSDPSGSM
jgi:pimeloyl-ACP methyl ester carboxylesterase